MYDTRNPDDVRDIEAEREELLAFMDKYISPDTKSSIDIATEATAKLTEYNIVVSYEGVADAVNE